MVRDRVGYFIRFVRPRLSVLIDLVARAGFTKEAWEIYNKYRYGEITYKKAKEKLKKLRDQGRK
ncbi:MAG: hypothetical protein DRO15_04475 [Thermoprotei archaeon]|nr:MAG: hypothetical protein DRO15_04475 [Thermoprotei archaeon]